MSASDWELVKDERAGGRRRVPACHDGSAFLTFECECGEYLHMHETQLGPKFDRQDELRLRCPSCATFLALPGGFVLDAFAEVKQAMGN